MESVSLVSEKMIVFWVNIWKSHLVFKAGQWESL